MVRLLVLAVASRLPAWAEAACADYLGRLPRAYAARRISVKPEPATGGRTAAQRLAIEAKRIEAALPDDCLRVALDERGRELDSAAFARALRGWLDRGAPVAFIVGSADGLDAGFRRSAQSTLRLSSLTLPHALA